MNEWTEAFREGWAEAIAEAERRCVKVWHNNEFVYAVPWTELVQIRQLVELAKKAVQS